MYFTNTLARAIMTVFISIIALTASYAQEKQKFNIVSSFEEFEKGGKAPLVYIRSAGISAGYYEPDFDFWNEQTIWGQSGSFIPAINIELRWAGLLNTRLEVGYFQSSNSMIRNRFWGEEVLSVQMIPVSFSAYLPFRPISDKNFSGYFGAGVSLTAVTNKYTSPSSDQSETGSMTNAFFLAGTEYIIGRYSVGLEGRYILGKYAHTIQLDPNSDPVTDDVDVSGPYVGVNIKYLF